MWANIWVHPAEYLNQTQIRLCGSWTSCIPSCIWLRYSLLRMLLKINEPLLPFSSKRIHLLKSLGTCLWLVCTLLVVLGYIACFIQLDCSKCTKSALGGLDTMRWTDVNTKLRNDSPLNSFWPLYLQTAGRSSEEQEFLVLYQSMTIHHGHTQGQKIHWHWSCPCIYTHKNKK